MKLFLYRVPEELYDFERDPDALYNLIDDPDYAPELEALQGEMAQWMERSQDPAREAFSRRDSPAALAEFMRHMGGDWEASDGAGECADWGSFFCACTGPIFV